MEADTVRKVLEERLGGILRAEIAASGGIAGDVAERLLAHPAYKSALAELRKQAAVKKTPDNESCSPPSSVDQHDQSTSSRADEERPKTVVWTFDSDDATSHGGMSSDCSGSSGSGRGLQDAFSREEWGSGMPDYDPAIMQRLAAQMMGSSGGDAATVLGKQRIRALQDLAKQHASDVLCDEHWPAVLTSIGASLLDSDRETRRAAADEICRLFAAALPGAFAFEIARTLGSALLGNAASS